MNILSAYKKIRNAGRVFSELNKQFDYQITNTAVNIVRFHVLMDPQNAGNTNIQRYKLRFLIELLTEGHFVECVTMLSSKLVDIMIVNSEMSLIQPDTSDSSFITEINKGLEANRKHLWEEMQRIPPYFLARLSEFKNAEVILAVINAFNTVSSDLSIFYNTFLVCFRG